MQFFLTRLYFVRGRIKVYIAINTIFLKIYHPVEEYMTFSQPLGAHIKQIPDFAELLQLSPILLGVPTVFVIWNARFREAFRQRQFGYAQMRQTTHVEARRMYLGYHVSSLAGQLVDLSQV